MVEMGALRQKKTNKILIKKRKANSIRNKRTANRIKKKRKAKTPVV